MEPSVFYEAEEATNTVLRVNMVNTCALERRANAVTIDATARRRNPDCRIGGGPSLQHD
jgi:hypothetical protein